jgi:Asp/Glu/hydantoin racemase
MVRKIYWASQNGYEAVIQSNTFDPGVEQGRLSVRIPVIGLFKTSLHVGLTLADRIGITVPLASHVPYTWRILRAYEMDKYVSSIKPIGIYGSDVQTHKQEIFQRMTDLISESVRDCGAEIILPLGGALIPYVVDPMDLQEATGIQVLNTKAIGIRHAEMCVNLGLLHSEFTYPPVKLSSDDLVSRS